MIANARAIAAIGNYAGKSEVESSFTLIGSNLEAAMNRHLWSPDQEFYVDVIRPNNPDLKPISGREEVGLYPYRFGIGLESNHSRAALALFDPQGFQAPYGPTTLEIRNQYYTAQKPTGYCCFWQGQVCNFQPSFSRSKRIRASTGLSPECLGSTETIKPSRSNNTNRELAVMAIFNGPYPQISCCHIPES